LFKILKVDLKRGVKKSEE